MSTTPKPTHTPGPWSYRRGPDRSYPFNIESDDGGTPVRAVREQDAARIVACVNACAGIPDPTAAIQKAREAMRGLLADKYLADPINADRMAPLAAALAALGGEG